MNESQVCPILNIQSHALACKAGGRLSRVVYRRRLLPSGIKYRRVFTCCDSGSLTDDTRYISSTDQLVLSRHVSISSPATTDSVCTTPHTYVSQSYGQLMVLNIHLLMQPSALCKRTVSTQIRRSGLLPLANYQLPVCAGQTYVSVGSTTEETAYNALQA